MKASELGISSEYTIAFKKKNWKPLCHIDDDVLVFNEGTLLLLNLTTYASKVISEFKTGALSRYLAKSRLLTRLLRLEPRAVLKINKEKILIPLKRKMYLLDLKTRELEVVHHFRREMSVPLNMAKIENRNGINNLCCYGEYFSNPEKEEVSIYGCQEDSRKWEEVYRFKKGEINHIHSIVPDPYTERVWILTGDYGEAAAIWYTDDGFQTVNKYVSGQQKYRSCVAFSTPEGLLYATDTPLEENYIYYLSSDKKMKNLYSLEGSSIYGTKCNEQYVFSTTVEGYSDGKEGKLQMLFSYKRGKGIKSWSSELVIGNLTEGFKRIGTFKKDRWPMGLMQFGTLTFPSGENQTDKLILYGSALKKVDGTLFILERMQGE